jgi:hypothetical protein
MENQSAFSFLGKNNQRMCFSILFDDSIPAAFSYPSEFHDLKENNLYSFDFMKICLQLFFL